VGSEQAGGPNQGGALAPAPTAEVPDGVDAGLDTGLDTGWEAGVRG
jgi:hypothetical protein